MFQGDVLLLECVYDTRERVVVTTVPHPLAAYPPLSGKARSQGGLGPGAERCAGVLELLLPADAGDAEPLLSCTGHPSQLAYARAHALEPRDGQL